MMKPVAWMDDEGYVLGRNSIPGEFNHKYPIPLYAIPEGYVVVPVEPTEAMLKEMHRNIDWCRTHQNTYKLEHPSQTSVKTNAGVECGPAGTTCKEDLIDAYKAMIQASQREGEK